MLKENVIEIKKEKEERDQAAAKQKEPTIKKTRDPSPDVVSRSHKKIKKSDPPLEVPSGKVEESLEVIVTVNEKVKTQLETQARRATRQTAAAATPQTVSFPTFSFLFDINLSFIPYPSLRPSPSSFLSH